MNTHTKKIFLNQKNKIIQSIVNFLFYGYSKYIYKCVFFNHYSRSQYIRILKYYAHASITYMHLYLHIMKELKFIFCDFFKFFEIRYRNSCVFVIECKNVVCCLYELHFLYFMVSRTLNE